jgi:hypothetical protein
MSTPYGSPGADPAGSQPTQPFWVGPDSHAASPTWGEQAGAAGPEPAASQAASFEDHLKKDRRKALHWTLALVAAALLIGGGTVAGLSLTGHSSPHSGQGQASQPDARQAALLNSALNNAGSPGSLNAAVNATEMSTAAKPGGARAGAAVRGPAAHRCAKARWVARQAGRAGLPRLARRLQRGATHCRMFHHRVFMFFLLHGVDGQFTIQTRQGDKTLAYERGVIQSVDAGKSFVVRAADGTTWTWDLVRTTVVRGQQGKVAESTLTTGTPIWVGGPVTGGAKDARLVILRPPVPAPVSPSPAPSG